jgi:energy-coupling factor transporter ATP-binding protein EcfA2
MGGMMLTRGSEWRRWEPHIHAPGTLLNDQFGGDDPWGTYLSTLEAAQPPIEALAITDYYTTDLYEEVLRRKEAGRLRNQRLIFPNIELRMDIAAKTGFVNLHLLVSPDDPAHVSEIRRFLSRLNFNAHEDRFDCTRDDLIRLGKKADASIKEDRAALAHGATQFKVNFAQLKTVFNESAWAKANVLIGVAGGSGDGTSGLRQAADKTIREEIERFAHVIFASSSAQREFWLGLRDVNAEQLVVRYGGCKPCLHGSDAHDQPSTGRPVGERFSWLKGSVTFDSLRQACIDPSGRAFIGAEPPTLAMPSQVISKVEIQSAPWVETDSIPLNSGLIAIIGSRGSGKTALADMLAAGCDAIQGHLVASGSDISPSFLARAHPLLGNERVNLSWGGGAEVARHLDGREASDSMSFPRARYLSQQFVEELCSSKGASEGLVREIERVIFEAHQQQDQEGALTFDELREHRTMRVRQSRAREMESVGFTSDRIATEMENEAQVAILTKQVSEKTALIKGYNTDLGKLVVKGTEAQARRHTALSEAAQAVAARVADLGTQRRTFVAMQDEVKNTRATRSPEMLREVQSRHLRSGLDATQWDAFLLVYKGDVDVALASYLTWSDGEIAKLNGLPPPAGEPTVPLIADDADLLKIQLATLKAEMGRLEKFISADTIIRNQYAALAKKIAAENGALQSLSKRLVEAQGAAERRKALQKEREESYGRLFEAIVGEQQALVELYEPLLARLGMTSGTLRKLGFQVTRSVDVVGWAKFGEEKLIDCRRSGPFYGLGSLERLAMAELKPAWEVGNAGDVQKAMTAFISAHSRDLMVHAPFAPTEREAFRQWSTEFAHWLFSTDHISVRYEIVYEGIDIRKLSPGTRGIVLLLLYLALDDSDDRPLIIDQPEENLDPKSVFDELVPMFIEAKSKRQVIMVTHNANLVINTDADQIIVASASPGPEGGLPHFTYVAGGLEDANIRKEVCDILEGGEKAFKERARRLRVRLER